MKKINLFWLIGFIIVTLIIIVMGVAKIELNNSTITAISSIFAAGLIYLLIKAVKGYL